MRNARHKHLLALGLFDRASRVRERIELLLGRGREFSGRASGARVAVSAALLLGVVGAGAFTPRWIAFAQGTSRIAFEIASVKPHTSGTGDPSGVRFLPGGKLTATNTSLASLVAVAYNISLQSIRLSGGQDWTRLRSERYDIEAAAQKGAVPDSLPGQLRTEKMRSMLQALLEDRFKLVVRRETKELPVYVVMVGKNGPKVPRAKIQQDGCPDDPAVTDAIRCHAPNGGQGRGVHGKSVSMSDLAGFVENWSDRPVMDRTELRELFDIDTEGWTPLVQNYGAGGGGGGGGDTDIADPLRPTIFTIFDQMGLKLEPARAPVEVFSIEHVERPSEN
jgi:uncharacterized protein (TIGR03435 family)